MALPLRLILIFSLLPIFVHGQQQTKKYVLVIHGGAGTIEPSRMTAELEQAYKAKLKEALTVGYEIIQKDGSALDAVEQTIQVLEDSPLFNAGKGAVFTHEGKNELDAAIMDGESLRAGAVAGVKTVRNPISAARAVMEKSEHVLLARDGAEDFARQVGLTMVDPSYFYTKERWDGLQKALQQEAAQKKADEAAVKLGGGHHDYKFGTVGCVALDNQGNLAAGTSTGGMTNKKFGRIGDSPIIGAGTYANNASVAVSCTGWGEFYIRNVVAYDVAALMDYRDLTVEKAAETALAKVAKGGGNGGLIALDKEGNLAMPFNTSGMYRGAISAEGELEVAIFKDGRHGPSN